MQTLALGVVGFIALGWSWFAVALFFSAFNMRRWRGTANPLFIAAVICSAVAILVDVSFLLLMFGDVR